MKRRAVPILIRKKARNQTDTFGPKNVGLKNVKFSQDPIKNQSVSMILIVVYRTAETATGLFEKRQIFSETYKKPMVRCENVLGAS